MNLQIINQKFITYKLDTLKISKIVDNIFINEKKLYQSISIILEDDDFLKKLKNQYFNQDMYTDVISFNLEDSGQPIDGEIYISLPRVNDNASSYSDNLNIEFKRIIIHGLLHLVGYDDRTDKEKEQMTNLENQYIKLNSGIIIYE